MRIKRPYPPDELWQPNDSGLFVPAPELSEWMRETFIEETGRAYNPDHSHLLMANIACLWSNVPYAKQQRPVAGQCEIPRPPQMVNAWAKARWNQQLYEWFGEKPDFLITLYAPTIIHYDNASFMALSEHELYHATVLRYTREGRPVWGILGHDVEEFVRIVERYGVGAAAGATPALVRAARRKPSVARADIRYACGTCRRAA